MALSAVLPVNWSPILIYFGITIILAMLDWTGLARAVRSKLLALREEDYCMAAQLMGAKTGRIIGRHLMPGFMSHLIATATLSIPVMILGETALSFLGLGLRPPITSWGVLLNEAQNINVVALYPWLMLPVVPVILIILAYSFFGDGLRDAADPTGSRRCFLGGAGLDDHEAALEVGAVHAFIGAEVEVDAQPDATAGSGQDLLDILFTALPIDRIFEDRYVGPGDGGEDTVELGLFFRLVLAEEPQGDTENDKAVAAGRGLESIILERRGDMVDAAWARRKGSRRGTRRPGDRGRGCSPAPWSGTW